MARKAQPDRGACRSDREKRAYTLQADSIEIKLICTRVRKRSEQIARLPYDG